MKRKTNVLAICQRNIPSALVGVIKPVNELNINGILSFKFVETTQITKRDIAETDILISIRGSEEQDLNIVKECKRLGKYLIYYMDDDLLNITKMSNSYEYFENELIKNNINTLMKLSDCLWTTSSVIASKYENMCSKVLVSHAPSLLIEEIESPIHFAENDIVKIGFAGGIDHEFFLEQFMEVPIRKIIEKYGNRVQLEFIGAKPSFIEKLPITYFPYQKSYEEYKNLMITRNWDIGLAPLPDSEFHACKYFNKFLEYGAIGAVGVYSDVLPYTRIIKSGVNGLLVPNNANDWVDAISYLIDKPEVRDDIRKRAYDQLKSEFTISRIAESLLQYIPELLEYRAPVCKEKDVILKKSSNVFYCNKFKSIIKMYGLKAPIHILKRIIIYSKTKF
jgi:hypothetical protein